MASTCSMRGKRPPASAGVRHWRSSFDLTASTSATPSLKQRSTSAALAKPSSAYPEKKKKNRKLILLLLLLLGTHLEEVLDALLRVDAVVEEDGARVGVVPSPQGAALAALAKKRGPKQKEKKPNQAKLGKSKKKKEYEDGGGRGSRVDAADEAFQVGQRLEDLVEVGHQRRVRHQVLDGVQPVLDGLRLAQRRADPAPQQPLPRTTTKKTNLKLRWQLFSFFFWQSQK